MPGNDDALVSTTLRLSIQSTIRKWEVKLQLHCTCASWHFRHLN